MSEKPRWRLRRERVRREWGYGTALERIAATAHVRGIPPELLDLDESQLKRWESGKTTPRKLSIWLLSETYGLPPDQLDLPRLPVTFMAEVSPTPSASIVRADRTPAKPAVPYVDASDGQSNERDVKRRQFLIVAAAFLAEGALGDQLTLSLTDSETASAMPHATVLDDSLDAAGIRDTTRAFRASQASQVAPIANRFYKGMSDLVLLTIDEQLVKSEVRYEAVPGWDEPFAHIYGPLNTDAVIDVAPFVPDAEGEFRFQPARTWSPGTSVT